MNDDYGPNFYIETILKCIYAIIITASIVISAQTIIQHNTYCKITSEKSNIQINEGIIQTQDTKYLTFWETRTKIQGIKPIFYGIGTQTNQTELKLEELKCQIKFLKEPLRTQEQIKQNIFKEE